MLIRKIQQKDLKQCAVILKNEYSKEPYNEIFIDNNEYKYIESKYKENKNNSFIVENNNIIVGFCFAGISFWTNGPQGILEEIVIDSNYQGKGIGKKIYIHMEKYFKKQGIKSLMLWVQNNANAYNFHLKNGFFKSDEHSIMFKSL